MVTIVSIQQYSFNLLDQAVDLLTKGWNTTKVEMAKELEAPFMKLIRLPLMKNYIVNDDKYSENGIHISFLNKIYPNDLLETMNSMEKFQLYKLIVNISKFYDFENIQNKIL